MHLITIPRLGAAITATALVLSVGTGPAAAAETSHVEATPSTKVQEHRDGRVATGVDLHRASTDRSLAKAATSDSAATAANVTKIKAYYAELYDPEVNFIDVEISLSDWTDVTSVDLLLKVDGKNKGSFPVQYFYDEDLGEEYEWIEVPGNIGLGKSVFTGSTVHYTEESGQASTADPTDSNSFNVRRGVTALEDDDEAIAQYGASGTRKSFEVYGLLVYSPSAGDSVPLKTVKLQYSKGGTWKTKKTMKLDADGHGFYTWKTSSKYRYRLYYASSTTFEGFVSGTTDKF